MPIAQPSFIPQPWANGNEDYRADVPNSAADAPAGRASWQMGYPPSTSLPLEAGGYAPARLDFNGGLYALSAHVFFQQSGSMYAWSSALDYNVGAAVLGSDGNEYRCVRTNGVSGTVKNPVNDTAHTYWKPLTLFLTDIIYPVGSIYMTTDNSNPGDTFGGTWQKIQNRFLLGSSSSRAATETGGTSTYTLSVSNMPQHKHTATAANSGAHTHNLQAASVTAASNGAHTHTTSGTAASNGAHTHNVGTLAVASNGAHTHTATTSSNGDHLHNVGTLATASGGSHTHTATTASAGDHTHGVGTLATASSGGHTHTRGTMDITGEFFGERKSESYVFSGAFYQSSGASTYAGVGDTDWDNLQTLFQASRSWTGATSTSGAHTHTISGATANAGSHTHTLTTATAGAHTHSISGKTANAGAHTHTLTTATSGVHTHALSGATAEKGAHTHTTSGTAAIAGAHEHTVSGTTATAGNHTHTITVGNTGGNTPFSIMPPYYVVNIWRRTA